MLNKDQSIVLQVAAKIASDMVQATLRDSSTDYAVAEWATATQTVYSVLAEMHGWEGPAVPWTAQVVQMAKQEFDAVEVDAVPAFIAPAADSELRIAGKAHGPIPAWLIPLCKKDGVTEVWDNRDTAVGTNRPLFKAVNGGKGYWDPSTSKFRKTA